MNNFKRNSRLIFKCAAAVFLSLGLSASVITSSAKHVHHYHFRTSRHAKIHHYRHRHNPIHLRRRRFSRRSRRISNSKIRKICHEIDHQTIYDINNDRRQRHLPALQLDRQLSEISNQRSYQLQDYFSHSFKHHKNEIQDLISHRKIHYNFYGENIASSPIGIINILDVGSYNNPNDSNQHYIKYHAKNGYQLANNVNNASMYHDAGDDYGHRDNDLSRQFRRMGVGVSYSRKDKNYYIAIEFIG